MVPRFFVNQPYKEKHTVVLPEKTAHHASRVLRMREGDVATLFDGRGHEAGVILHFFADRTEAEIVTVQKATTESPVQTTLLQSLVNQEKLDWILEKATELGVTRIVIMPAARSVTKLDDKRLAKRLEQWQKTVIAACEQCGRSVFPEVVYEPTLKAALGGVSASQKILLAPGSNRPATFRAKDTVAIAVGPEGGFDETEIELAQSLGFESTVLGPRILRTETAGLAALAVIQWEVGDF